MIMFIFNGFTYLDPIFEEKERVGGGYLGFCSLLQNIKPLNTNKRFLKISRARSYKYLGRVEYLDGSGLIRLNILVWNILGVGDEFYHGLEVRKPNVVISYSLDKITNRLLTSGRGYPHAGYQEEVEDYIRRIILE